MTGSFTYDLSHLLGGAILVLSFAMLTQRRLPAVITLYAAQGVTLAAAAAWQGVAQASPELFLTAAITLAAKAVAIPLVLRRMASGLGLGRNVETALGVFPTMVLGVALVALAVLVVLPTTAQSQAMTREDLALALSVVLLGLLMMITRRTAFTQVIGFMATENGLILAAIGIAGLPLLVELAVAVLVMVGAFLFGVFFFRIRARFDSLDLGHLDAVHRARRETLP